MAKTTAVMTARRACRILDWVIKYLTIAQERLCKTKRPPVRAAAAAKGQIWDADCAPPERDAAAGGLPWDVDCPPPQNPMKGEPLPWDVDCAPLPKPANVDLCIALAACVADLKLLRKSLRKLPPGRRLG